ncbi:hypothetical protein [Paludibaculum fermentans]|uniref:Carboxypeptidase regulatory-like domain-containing protein n=1 Tax=Paludibaculum fermentans TaxID=1473598 RepID=A0A7S7SPD6_PALFE|nr:hypothetical protein [Paludibaculum fermentans]QOY91808.1 hypothetical protein IRI77_18265 [Paludibaculum fermentans]
MSLLLLLFAAQHPASACFCFPRPLCSELSASGGQRAIFVGTVSEIYPEVEGAKDAGLAEGGGMTLRQAKTLLQERWRGVLSAKEIVQIQRARSINELLLWNARITLATRRVRFRVAEWLQGGRGRSFELFTDISSCGYRFASGGTYLVVATLEAESGRWQTGACMRNAPADTRLAREDLKALRAARDGRPLLPRVYGEVLDWREGSAGFKSASGPPHAVLRLTGPASRSETASDDQGWFSFDDLPRGTYRLELLRPPLGGGGTTIDLSRTGCSEASVLLEKGSERGTYTVLVSPAGEQPPPSAIPLEEPQVELPPNIPLQLPDALRQGLFAPEHDLLHRAPSYTPPLQL